MKSIPSLLALLIGFGLVSIVTAQVGQSPQGLCAGAEPGELTTMQFAEAENVIDQTLDYRAILCTSAGAVYVDLYEKLTPTTVNNFVFLAQLGYYDNTSFHRVIPEFMVQGGDPTATGRGGPGYQFQDEPVGFLTFDRPGLLAMANAGPGTNGSQFFVTTVPTPHLNYKHTIFGDVLLGQDNVLSIRERDPQTASGPGDTLQTVLIITDPTSVDNSAVVDVPDARQDEVVAAFEAFVSGLPPTLPVDDARSGLFSIDDISASVPENLQGSFAEYANEFGLQYRYGMTVTNGECSPSIFFSALAYSVDVLQDADAAEAAMKHEITRDLVEAQGFKLDSDSAATYMRNVPTCAGEPGAHVLSLYTRGRYLVTIEVMVDVSVLDQAPAAQLLDNLGLQIEGALAGIFRGEIR